MNQSANFDNSLLPTAIRRVEDLDAVLTTISLSSKGWLSDVIVAQKQLVRSVENPYVFDASVDTVVTSMHRALRQAQNDEETEQIRGAFSDVIQSLMTYLDAYTRIYLDDIRDSVHSVGKKCFRSAASVLSNSIQSTALLSAGLYASNGDSEVGYSQNDIVKLFRNNSYAEKAEQSFLDLASSIYDWFHLKNKEKQTIAQYAESVRSVVEKLCKYKKMFGGNIIIAGVMQRSVDFLEKYYNECMKNKEQPLRTKNEIFFQGKRILLAALLVLGIIMALIGIGFYSEGNTSAGTLLFIPLTAYIFLRIFISKKRASDLKKNIELVHEEFDPKFEKLQFYREEAKYFDNIWQPE